MTDAEWQVSADPMAMVEHREPAYRPEVAAVCVRVGRRLWPRLIDEAAAGQVVIAERYTDGFATGQQLFLAWNEVQVAGVCRDPRIRRQSPRHEQGDPIPGRRSGGGPRVAWDAADLNRLRPAWRAPSGASQAAVLPGGNVCATCSAPRRCNRRAVRYPVHVTGLAEACYDAFPEATTSS